MIEGRAERPDTRRVRSSQFVPVQILAVEEERLPEVLRSPQVGAASADAVSGLGRLVSLADQVSGETRPGLVPAIPVTRGDLPGDGQALADIGHPRIGLADAALQLAVERDVIEIQPQCPPIKSWAGVSGPGPELACSAGLPRPSLPRPGPGKQDHGTTSDRLPK